MVRSRGGLSVGVCGKIQVSGFRFQVSDRLIRFLGLRGGAAAAEEVEEFLQAARSAVSGGCWRDCRPRPGCRVSRRSFRRGTHLRHRASREARPAAPCRSRTGWGTPARNRRPRSAGSCPWRAPGFELHLLAFFHGEDLLKDLRGDGSGDGATRFPSCAGTQTT